MSTDDNDNVPDHEDGLDSAVLSDRWRVLPARVPVEEQSTSMAVSDPEDPEGGRNPDNDWLLRGV